MALVTRSEEPRAHMVRGRKSQELIWTRSEEPRAHMVRGRKSQESRAHLALVRRSEPKVKLYSTRSF